MRALFPTVIAAFSIAATPAFADDRVGDAPDTDIQAVIDDMAQVARDMREITTTLRLDTPPECRGNGACVDGYFDAMATTSLVFELESEAVEQDPKAALMIAEAIAFQAAFTYDAYGASGDARGAAGVCRSMRQAAVIGNSAVDIIRAACNQGVVATQCADLAAGPVIEPLQRPRCGARMDRPIAD